MLKRLILPALVVSATASLADVPRVASDIAPVHGLVAAVMGDLGQPALVVPRGSSPHDFALRPSEARALQNADLVVWIGPDLMPNMVKPLSTLAQEAVIMTLADLPGTHLLENRAEAVFGDGPDHAEADHAEADDHGDADDHDHADTAHDPHTWMDPGNAMIWLEAIAAQLGDLDAENAATYRANAQAAGAAIADAVTEAEARLSPVHERGYLSLHDAYQYFEAAFDLHPVGAVSLSDASAPGPARLAGLRDILARGDITCVLAEPGEPMGYLTALGDSDRLSVTEVDPMGGPLPLGAGFYPALIRDTAARIADCLALPS